MARRDDYRMSFRATTDDRGAARRYAHGAVAISGHTEYMLKKMRDEAEDAFRIYVPEDSGRMMEGIRGIVFGRRELVITVRAEDPDTGFDYVDVTRFGHRVDRIYAGAKSRSATSPVGRFTAKGELRRAPVGGARALATKLGFFRSVKGYKPARDWAEPAFSLIEELGARNLEVLGRGVARDLSR